LADNDMLTSIWMHIGHNQYLYVTLFAIKSVFTSNRYHEVNFRLDYAKMYHYY